MAESHRGSEWPAELNFGDNEEGDSLEVDNCPSVLFSGFRTDTHTTGTTFSLHKDPTTDHAYSKTHWKDLESDQRPFGIKEEIGQTEPVEYVYIKPPLDVPENDQPLRKVKEEIGLTEAVDNEKENGQNDHENAFGVKAEPFGEPPTDSLGSLKLADEGNGGEDGHRFEERFGGHIATHDVSSQTSAPNSPPGFEVDKDGDTPLHMALIHNFSVQKLLKLLGGYENVLGDFVDSQNYLKQTALHLAVLMKQVRIVKLLLELGAKTDVRDRRLRTPMMAACETGPSDILEAFFSGDNSPPSDHLDIPNDQGVGCLHIAVAMGNTEMARLLIDNGANINLVDRRSGRTPLHVAADTGNVEMVDLLLEYEDIDCDARTYGSTGDTALELAYMRGRPEVMELLKPVSDPIRKRKQRSDEEDEGD